MRMSAGMVCRLLAAAVLAGCVSEDALPPLADGEYLKASISDSARFATNERLAKAFAFLQRPDLSSLPVGRYEIDGDDVFAFVQECVLKPVSEMKVEAHRKYIDIQAPLSSPEMFGVGRLTESNYELPFDEEKDIGFYEQSLDVMEVKPGDFVMFVPPYAAHGPCCTLEGRSTVRKVVVKVRKR